MVTIWQKVWLLSLTVFSLMHLTRDILQDKRIKILISTIVTKKIKPPTWSLANLWTYLLALVEIVLSIIILLRGYFGALGEVTLSVAVLAVALWLHSWFKKSQI